MYYLLYTICYLFSLLPFWILYRLSDILYLLVYYVFAYRKNVVLDNLQQSFPEKNKKEIEQISKHFYHHLCDMVIEVIKMTSIGRQQLQKRSPGNFSVLNQLHQQGKSCQLHLGHSFNWEWASLSGQLNIDAPLLVVYMPLSNKVMDKLLLKIRSRFGGVMIPATELQTALQPWKNKCHTIVLVADQNPGNPRRTYWEMFLHRMTAFYKGPELSARHGDIPVVWANIKKVKRGYYNVIFELAFEHPAKEKEGAITKAFVHNLEKNIYQQPDNWLWSHRRWKHQYKGEEVKKV